MLDKVNILVLRIILKLAGLIPLSSYNFISICGSYIICSIFKREREICSAQLGIAFPNLSQDEILSLTRESYKSLCMLVLECAKSKTLLNTIEYPHDISKPESKYFKFVDSSGIKAVKDAGEGAVCLVSHTGNFELMAGFFIKKGIPLTVIAREPNYKILIKVIENFRSSYGLEFLWREDMGNPKRLLKAIKTGRFLGALIDQDTSLDSVYAEFFGLPCAHPRGPISIAVRMNKPVFIAFDARLDDGTHQIYTKKVNWEALKSTKSIEELEDYILKEYCRELEAHIRKYPSQWVWWHRRWRRVEGQDPLSPISTSQYLELLKQKRVQI
jgi:KDO2-lipid IV(A) lauroyltransferase